jgi:hypothetical protein
VEGRDAVKRRPLTDAPERLTQEQRERVMIWCSKRYPMLYPQLKEQWNRFVDWHLANGVLRCDWSAAFRNWLRKAHEISATRAVDVDRPLAQVIPLRRRVGGE